jgi:hypothetical protein
MLDFLTGAIAMGYFVAGLFFLKFWKRSQDRLFAIFAVAFFVLCVQRLAFLVIESSGEHAIFLYVIRLLAFTLILAAIVDKNRSANKNPA